MNDVNGIAELLFNEGTLFDLNIGRWAAIKKMKSNEVLLGDIDEQAIYLGHKRLLPKEATETIIQVEGKARSLLASRSTIFPIAGARFVALRALPQLIEQMGKLRESFFRAVDDLVNAYPDLRGAQLSRLNKVVDDLAAKELAKYINQPEHPSQVEKLKEWSENEKKHNSELFPPWVEVRERFRFDWHLFKVSAFEGDGSTVSAEQMLEAQQKMKNDLQRWVHEATVSMHRSLGQAAMQARSLLQRQGKMNPRNIKPLFDAFDTFKAIDFTGSATVQQMIDRVREQFGVMQEGHVNLEATAEAANRSQEAFSELLDTMSQLSVQETAEKAGMDAINRAGRFSRVIEM
jgi:hypothetical protein